MCKRKDVRRVKEGAMSGGKRKDIKEGWGGGGGVVWGVRTHRRE